MSTSDSFTELHPYIISQDEVLNFVVFFIRYFDAKSLDESYPDTIDIEDDDPIYNSDSVRILYDMLIRILENCSDNQGKRIYAVYVPIYDDRYYRSSYSLYYIEKHFQLYGPCGRLFLFDGGLFDELKVKKKEMDSEVYDKSFIGSLVKKPLPEMEIGRTLIDPKFFYGKDSCFQFRTAYYSETMYGIRMHVYGFPFAMQDGETVTCAEMTILNISDYFSRRYQAYHAVYPYEISRIIHANSYERNIPSRGLSYQNISKVFLEIGFFPRLYAAKYEIGRFLTILHSYVASGIPVAMGIDNGLSNTVGHSVVVIGMEKDFFKNRTEPITINDLYIQQIPNKQTDSTIYYALIGSKSGKYIIMDDGRAPYAMATISANYKTKGEAWQVKLSYGPNPYDSDSTMYLRDLPNTQENTNKEIYNVSFLTAPLSKDMSMDAEDAIRCFKNIIGSVVGNDLKTGPGYIAYFKHIKEKLNEDDFTLLAAGESENNPLILRVFICAARSLKRHRVKTVSASVPKSVREKCLITYQRVHMPRFIWVCELYSLNSISIDPPVCLGEIVLDATTVSSHKSDIENIILINYPGKLAFRMPFQKKDDLIDMLRTETDLGEQFRWPLLIPFSFEDAREN